MKARYLAIGVTSALAFAAAPVFADHNSPNEEGWANMPNDIHNTRIDTRESGDNEAFREFVQYGEGADSVNRFADDDTTPSGNQAQQGNADAAQAQAQAKQMSGTRTQVKNGAQTQTKQMGGTRTQSSQMGGAQTKTQQGTAEQNRTRTQLKDGTGTGSRAKTQRRTRYDPATGSNARRHDRRQGSGKRGGGKG